MKENFHRLRPNAPDPASDIQVDVAWNEHVEMGPFRDLYWCRLQGRLRETLTRIDQSDFTPPPLPYRVDSKTYDYSKHHSWPIHVQTVRLIISDLAVLSLKGHAPAMVTLAKLSARDDVIRLTPRFMYFLLSRAKRTVSLDAKAQRLLTAASTHLSAEERTEIQRRVESGDWPLEEAMTLD